MASEGKGHVPGRALKRDGRGVVETILPGGNILKKDSVPVQGRANRLSRLPDLRLLTDEGGDSRQFDILNRGLQVRGTPIPNTPRGTPSPTPEEEREGDLGRGGQGKESCRREKRSGGRRVKGGEETQRDSGP